MDTRRRHREEEVRSINAAVMLIMRKTPSWKKWGWTDSIRTDTQRAIVNRKKDVRTPKLIGGLHLPSCPIITIETEPATSCTSERSPAAAGGTSCVSIGTDIDTEPMEVCFTGTTHEAR